MDLTSQIIVCVLAADFVTGVVHWWEDTYGDPAWPILGPAVIEPNIQHHEKPTVFVTMSNLALRNYQPMALAIVACGIAWAGGLLSWTFALVALLAACGNETHAWAHVRPKHWLPRLLQEMAIAQTPQHHAKHHRAPYNDYFCSLTNVVNPVLSRLKFWPAVEWAIARTTGIEPLRMTEARRGK